MSKLIKTMVVLLLLITASLPLYASDLEENIDKKEMIDSKEVLGAEDKVNHEDTGEVHDNQIEVHDNQIMESQFNSEKELKNSTESNEIEDDEFKNNDFIAEDNLISEKNQDNTKEDNNKEKINIRNLEKESKLETYEESIPNNELHEYKANQSDETSKIEKSLLDDEAKMKRSDNTVWVGNKTDFIKSFQNDNVDAIVIINDINIDQPLERKKDISIIANKGSGMSLNLKNGASFNVAGNMIFFNVNVNVTINYPEYKNSSVFEANLVQLTGSQVELKELKNIKNFIKSNTLIFDGSILNKQNRKYQESIFFEGADFISKNNSSLSLYSKSETVFIIENSFVAQHGYHYIPNMSGQGSVIKFAKGMRTTESPMLKLTDDASVYGYTEYGTLIESNLPNLRLELIGKRTRLELKQWKDYEKDKEISEKSSLYFKGEELEFSISNGAEFILEANNSYKPAMSFNVPNTNIKIEEQSQFKLNKSERDLSFVTDIENSDYASIYYKNGNNDIEVTGEDSIFMIESAQGPGIYADGNSKLAFLATNQSSVVIRSKGLKDNHNIIHADLIGFGVVSPKYFDLRNSRSAKAPIFSHRSSEDKLYFLNTDFALWDDTSDLDKDPLNRWHDIFVTIDGEGYKGISVHDDVGIPNNLEVPLSLRNEIEKNGLSAYSRISGSKYNPIVLGIQQAYDSDKYVYGKLLVPESPYYLEKIYDDSEAKLFNQYEHFRSPWSDEYEIELIEEKNGKRIVHTINTTNENENWKIYDPNTSGFINKENAKGYFRYGLGAFLEKDTKYELGKIYKKIRLEDGSGNISEKYQEVEVTNERTNFKDSNNFKSNTIVRDITPPNVAVITTSELNKNTKHIEGSASADAVKAILYINGNEIAEKNIDQKSWRFDLEHQLVDGDTINIALEDNDGNRNPLKETVHHDAIFQAAPSMVYQDLSYVIKGQNYFVSLYDKEKLPTSIETLKEKLKISVSIEGKNTKVPYKLESKKNIDFENIKPGTYEFEVIVKEAPNERKTFKLVVLDKMVVEKKGNYVITGDHIYGDRNSHKLSDRELIKMFNVDIYKFKNAEVIENIQIKTNALAEKPNANPGYTVQIGYKEGLFFSNWYTVDFQIRTLDYDHVSETRKTLIAANDFNLQLFQVDKSKQYITPEEILFNSQAVGFVKNSEGLIEEEATCSIRVIDNNVKARIGKYKPMLKISDCP